MLWPSSRVTRHYGLILTLFFLSGSSAVPSLWAAPSAIRVDVSPNIGEIRPMKDLVNIRVVVESQAEGAVDLSFRLLAPRREGTFTTDFPLVEGTELIQMAVRVPDGKLDWSYAFPIRGTYRLELKAVDANGSVVERMVLLEVMEAWTKSGFLLGFLGLLFVLGVVAGRLFTRERSWNAHLLVGVLGILTLARVGDAVADLASTLVVSPPRVGSLSAIHWTVAEDALSRVDGALLTMKITQLEKDRTLFSLNSLPTQGNFKFDYQFTDASDHRIAATAVLESGEIVGGAEEIVQVTSPDPSLEDSLRPVALSLLVVTAGLILGRFSRRRAARRSF